MTLHSRIPVDAPYRLIPRCLRYHSNPPRTARQWKTSEIFKLPVTSNCVLELESNGASYLYFLAD